MKDHVSPSQITTFRNCPQLWAYTTLDGKREVPTGARHLGSAFHSAAETHNRVKVTDKVGLTTDQIEDAFSTEFRSIPPSEVDWQGDTADKTYDDGARLARLFGVTAAREVQPTQVELKILVPTAEGGLPVECRIDLIDDREAVRDYKTASKSPSADSAEDSDQLTSYAAAYEVRFGHLPSAVVLDYFVKPLKTKPTGMRVPLTDVRTPAQVAIWRRDVAAQTSQMRHAESTGLFPLADPGSWKCSAKWCGFFAICPGGAPRRSSFANVIAFPAA